VIAEAIDGVKLSVPGSLSHIKQNAVTNLSIQQDVHFRREHSSVDVKVALLLYTNQLLYVVRNLSPCFPYYYFL